jgi:hypothetical protein
VRWMFAQRRAGHSLARITRALNDAAIPCPLAGVKLRAAIWCVERFRAPLVARTGGIAAGHPISRAGERLVVAGSASGGPQRLVQQPKPRAGLLPGNDQGRRDPD